MATTPQGDDPNVRRTVMYGLARAVARQRLAGRVTAAKPKSLKATYLRAAPGAKR